jgi:CHASE3 domain sensor protein
MKKELSPVFVLIVILVAIALGALYFMARYRADEARWAREKAAAQRVADQTRSRMLDSPARERARRGKAESGFSATQPGRSAAGESEPGEQ